MPKGNLAAIAAGALVAAVVLVWSTCTFMVDERYQAVVTRLGKPVHVIVGSVASEEFQRVKQEILDTAYGSADDAEKSSALKLRVDMGSGLYFKVPFLDTVTMYDDVVLAYDAEPEEIVTADKQKLTVDTFARWHIDNPLRYRIRVRSTEGAHRVLDDTIYSIVREELAKTDMIEVIRTSNEFTENASQPKKEEATPEAQLIKPMRETIRVGREEIMKSVAARADKIAREDYGIQVIDVRFKRADLLKENLESVYGRMRAEREAISKAYRSEGQKQAEIIEGTTNRKVQVISAEAERDAKKLKGEGDAEAIRVFAGAFGSNAKLYEYMRSLDVIAKDTPEGAEMVIGLDSSIYSLLKKPQLQPPLDAPHPAATP
ncbi:MAG: protease modulator HflC [Candidatus Hydrogenedentes bacterium]|nr:protease modulator HflC [Candidatus Hydrogenedentota bacterium]